MTVVYVSLPRDEVVSYLGPAWPPLAEAIVLRCPNPAGVTDGAVVIYTTPGQPGVTWWLVDSVIPPQQAGPVDESLALLIPESELVAPAPPDTQPDPPAPPPWGVNTADADSA